MVSATESTRFASRLLLPAPRLLRGLAVVSLLCASVIVIAGCSPAAESSASAEETAAVGANMAGASVDVNVLDSAIAAMPKKWVLTTPESAVRSYLDWTAYAYRIGQSKYAVPTMTTYEEVRVDSYVQFNFQKKRLIDQTLDSITFGKQSMEATRVLLPAHEEWTYSYVSIEVAGKVVGGPYKASYDTTYTVVKSDKGGWLVDSVEAKAIGTVK